MTIGAREYYKPEMATTKISIIEAYNAAQENLGLTEHSPLNPDPIDVDEILMTLDRVGALDSAKILQFNDITRIMKIINEHLGEIVQAQSINLRQYTFLKDGSEELLATSMASVLVEELRASSREAIDNQLATLLCRDAKQYFLRGWTWSLRNLQTRNNQSKRLH